MRCSASGSRSAPSISILWSKWFHTDKILLILHRDSPLPSHLLSPSPYGRYSTIQCRVAASKLFSFLKEWASFVLLDTHSYVRVLPPSAPRYFCVIRVAQKHPCIVLHVNHIEGTPYLMRKETFSNLQQSIAALQMSLDSLQASSSVQASLSVQVTPSRRRSTAQLPKMACATILTKQLNKALIR